MHVFFLILIAHFPRVSPHYHSVNDRYYTFFKQKNQADAKEEQNTEVHRRGSDFSDIVSDV